MSVDAMSGCVACTFANGDVVIIMNTPTISIRKKEAHLKFDKYGVEWLIGFSIQIFTCGYTDFLNEMVGHGDADRKGRDVWHHIQPRAN